MTIETELIMAHATCCTLSLPPEKKIYLLGVKSTMPPLDANQQTKTFFLKINKAPSFWEIRQKTTFNSIKSGFFETSVPVTLLSSNSIIPNRNYPTLVHCKVAFVSGAFLEI